MTRRRAARVAAVVGVLALCTWLSALGTRATETGAARPAAEPKPPLPSGCEERRLEPFSKASLDGPEDVLGTGDARARVQTSCGVLLIDLFEDRAPLNVNNFAFLANEGFYDGLPFFRVEKDSVVQTGDPNGHPLDAPNGPGYTVPDELAAAHYDGYVYGVVAMANRWPVRDSAGSQFFIVVHDREGAEQGDPEPAGYRPRYTIIGRVARSSWGVLERIAEVDTKGGIDLLESVEPVAPVTVDSVEIGQR